MTLEEFTKDAGVTIVECDPDIWGGRIGYKEKDYPLSTVCGFGNNTQARMHWLNGKFGEHTAKAILKLLKRPNVEHNRRTAASSPGVRVD